MIIKAALLKGQPVLTYENVAPEAGASFIVYAGGPMEEGVSGENQVWDLTDFVVDSIFVDHIEPSGPPIANCPYVDQVSLRDADEFFELTADHLTSSTFNGFDLGDIMNVDREILRFPLHYGDTTYATWNFGSIVSLDSGGCSHYQGGSYLYADGYGLIQTPFGTFGPVLQVKFRGDVHIGPNVYFGDQERYYLPGLHYPVATFMWGEFITSLPGVNQMIDPTTVGIQALTTSRTGACLYPSPAYDQLYVTLPDDIGRVEQINVADLQGRIVQTDNMIGRSKQLAVSVSALASGVYVFCVVKEGRRSPLGRFIKN